MSSTGAMKKDQERNPRRVLPPSEKWELSVSVLTGQFTQREVRRGVAARPLERGMAALSDHFAPVKTREDAGDARALRLLTTEGPSRVKAQAWERLAPTA